MTKRRDLLLAQVVATLAEWDPIGVSPHSSRADLEDEYRGYARGITEMLLRGVEARRLEDHLRSLCETQIGVSGDKAREARAATSLLALVSQAPAPKR